MSESFPELFYRPGENDDWGDVRTKDGRLILKIGLHAGGHQSEEDLARHRKNGTDPCEVIGKRVIRACNDLSRITRALRQVEGRHRESADKFHSIGAAETARVYASMANTIDSCVDLIHDITRDHIIEPIAQEEAKP